MNAWGLWVLAAVSLFALVVIISGILDLFTTTAAERRSRRDETAQYRAMRRALRTDRRRRYVDAEEEA